MKKLFITACLLAASQNIFAQLSAGMVAVGLTSAITANKTSNEYNFNSGNPNKYYSEYVVKQSTFNVSPSVSYFLSNRFAVGAQVGYVGYANTTETTDKYNALPLTDYSYTKTTSAGISVMPYVTYYIPLNDSNKVYFFVKGSYNFQNSTGKTSGYTETTSYDGSGNVTNVVRSDEYGPNKTNTIGMQLGISPGLLFMPGKKIGIEFSLGNLLGINSTISKTDDDNGNTSKATTTNLEYFNFNTLSVGTGIYYFFR
ncbi:porin family protein [Cytophaga hutchinsonii]|uniref:Outer membrane protein beta-barrel domain-containing protein n=1 Tax=Cytophaga hutchinsonii (strain ATCC 33406 / DSM 1761 / CIP 103989 / NBRC 15051 / NCIMB 9469 / D465) TaxID=269798 RepID=A0A6N4STR8_CYTH3|nr:porin family protein [Cytophaga hutchinsonii]ABG59759.1 conserved hypothetical protein [Cytophaga hutchinsonii ATCC 33406]SFX64679.1 Outer membrane protein beta-barrel domain-containing protein [Cytophaga hutchinsonii ATCC 33406]